MRYQVMPPVFQLEPQLKFGIVIGKNLQNGETSATDLERLREAEASARVKLSAGVPRDWPTVAFYRDVMTRAGINPNKYPVSVEAMLKRVVKGGSLPVINALVDLCNAVSLEHLITLGAHDLADIQEDLAVRFATGNERFLPFGETEQESVEPGELIFTSGDQVQTRKWIWRQSELGKTTLASKDIIFQLVGFEDEPESSFRQALESIERLVVQRFQGTAEAYVVSSDHTMIEFDR
ncbi:B3/B4 domain-containing protein [Anoxynatronum buryatiense]|uniref:Phosphoenolpyruvate synthase n=1 Tax=Anoxynatronum buryatiense TaxID=489973 RepID=A0AA46AJC5_9CLOT|nr:phenylalanine--tRNA ligase beta subunit-related protein [Anoxynatronum buryatiense]SMP60545.1 phosphoenolpyruvate synthase [Anoxynatronum buryatiense]